jgi:hypothetical protein
MSFGGKKMKSVREKGECKRKAKGEIKRKKEERKREKEK